MSSSLDYAALAAAPAGGLPRTVVGALLNYRQALEQLGEAASQPPYKAPPKAPILYIKPANTYAGQDSDIVLPADVPEVEIGACLGIVFGRKATRVSEQSALDYVAGYRIVADLSVPHASFYRPPIKQKCRDGFCPMAARTVPRAEVPDPDDLAIEMRIDGKVAQQAHTRDLIRPVARLIADVTRFMSLDSGDVLLVGVPAGAPRARAGQRYEIDIARLGSLANRLVAA
ncbi:fumarylacetoacetate hydrolase family protein [Candidimonas humi]|uniref:Fumarylacetoacetate hydrolase family protein n=1 Tax=Candidimonas humi TaxID=683355 RepID=A0ABV8NX29_9BURK|nr:fumarylacetoacetate hydrolase family protein [Candidimonas humi]MBV6303989.1 fumarylacetoacetate hydrolase family protein [Candidimonas humi]